MKTNSKIFLQKCLTKYYSIIFNIKKFIIYKVLYT